MPNLPLYSYSYVYMYALLKLTRIRQAKHKLISLSESVCCSHIYNNYQDKLQYIWNIEITYSTYSAAACPNQPMCIIRLTNSIPIAMFFHIRFIHSICFREKQLHLIEER